MLQGPKQLKQWQRPCGTSSLSTMVFPRKYLTDQGCNFESQLVADLCELMGVQKIQTSLYHLQTNGQCERFNSTLINMLGTLPKEKKSEWKNHVGTLVHAYNCTCNSATGFSPYYLMFGRQTSPSSWCGTWFGSMHHHGARHNQVCSKVKRTKQVGSWKSRKPFRQRRPKGINVITMKKGRAVALEVRDMVLVHVTTFKGRHKMQDRWENREYVVEKCSPILTYQCMWYAPGMGKGAARTLHRNYLLPISSNMGQDETDGSEDRVKNNTSLTPVPSVSGSTQSSPDQPAPVRHGVQTTRGQLPWRYQNFGLLTDTWTNKHLGCTGWSMSLFAYLNLAI